MKSRTDFRGARLAGACGCVSGREGPETNERTKARDWRAMFNPVAVAMAVQGRQTAGQNNAGIHDLLSVFEDSVSFRMLLLVLCGVLSGGVAWVSFVVILVLPKPASVVYWLCGGCFSLSVSIAIYLLEPRPQHLVPTLERIRESLGSPSSWGQSARRWWRWRKKYENRTKLNV